MDTKQLVLIPLLILLAVGIGFGFFLSVRATYQYLTGAIPEAARPIPAAREPNPSVNVQKGSGDEASVTITWNDLPGDADRLNVYRAHIGLDDWELWQTIFLGKGRSSGSATFFFAPGEKPDDYIYYTEARSDDEGGSGGWTSPPATAEEPPPPAPPPPAPPPPVPPAPTSTPTSTPPAPPPPVPPAPTSTPTSTPPAAEPTSTPTSTVETYYTPEIQISGYGNPNEEHFWVRHVNHFIELGWQNLPSSTDKLVVSRSDSDQGPWEALLTQESPVIAGPYVFRLADNSASAPHYYRLETFAGTAALETYGPILLEADTP